MSFYFISCITTRPISYRGLADIVDGLLPANTHAPPAPNTAQGLHTAVDTSSSAASALGITSETPKNHASVQSRTVNNNSEHVGTFAEMATRDSTTRDSATTTAWPASATTARPIEDVGYSQGASHMPPGEATEWKVIGITVLCITFVGSIMLAAFFSEAWLGLMKDVCLGRNRKRLKCGEENLVPDWEKRSWEYRLADEEGHRYPTVSSSLQSMGKLQEKNHPAPGSSAQLEGASPLVTPPAASYLPDADRHPLDPLFRRPSCKYNS
ncbi:hypothetical protein AX17_000782 [Amanita inopinata Kibby_2008]|nr:hypothetical protein AX17_000782 [Amanita inopinata Kibby_2008]